VFGVLDVRPWPRPRAPIVARCGDGQGTAPATASFRGSECERAARERAWFAVGSRSGNRRFRPALAGRHLTGRPMQECDGHASLIQKPFAIVSRNRGFPECQILQNLPAGWPIGRPCQRHFRESKESNAYSRIVPVWIAPVHLNTKKPVRLDVGRRTGLRCLVQGSLCFTGDDRIAAADPVSRAQFPSKSSVRGFRNDCGRTKSAVFIRVNDTVVMCPRFQFHQGRG